jgi:hypothetical protein
LKDPGVDRRIILKWIYRIWDRGMECNEVDLDCDRWRAFVDASRFYGCETWSLTLKEELSLRVFENRVLRVLYGPKKDQETGE